MIERFLLVNVPAPLLCLLLVAGTTLVSLGGLWVVNRSRELQTLETHNDVAGFIIAIVGVIYAVLIALWRSSCGRASTTPAPRPTAKRTSR